MNNKKVIIIGFDGGTFSVIDKLIEENKLPHLKQLMEEGTRSTLTSTVQPSSEQAWASFSTGLNNGKHGIFGFLNFKEDYSFKLVSGLDRKGDSLWKILGEYDKKSIVVNMPMSYPPEKINGIIVGGFLSPNKNSNYTYPEELKEEINEEFPDYIIDVHPPNVEFTEEKKIDKFVNKSLMAIEQRYKLASHLMKKNKWDLFTVVFTTSDRIQHKFWDCKYEKYSDVLERIYIKIDEKIGELIKEQEGHIIVASDHGFTKLEKEIALNVWLYQKGFLKVKDSKKTKSNKTLKILKFFKNKFMINNQRLLTKFPFLNKFVSSMLYKEIDWENTKAFAVSSGNIRINLKEREAKGCVNKEEYEGLRNKLIEEIKNFKDPISGRNVCKKVYKREEIYKGPYVKDAPDIINLFDERYKPSMGIKNKEKVFIEEGDPLFNERNPGNHHMNGILVIKGPEIREKIILDEANIMDIAPTVLHLMEVPIPEEIDGKVLKNIFKEGSKYAKERAIKDSSEKIKIQSILKNIDF
tara:strand:- start:198 stop:1766 length:1569 start_codon:yes stop_codon:yes gene_type:complete